MMWALIIGVPAIVIAGGLWVLVHGTKRAAFMALGRPTPDAARVVVDAVETATETKANEVRSAPLAQKIDRARALRDRGRVRID